MNEGGSRASRSFRKQCLRYARKLEEFAERTFRITCKMFMDAHTFHEARIRQCCVHVGTFEDDPRRYSFCWRWLFEEPSDFGPRRFTDRAMTALRACEGLVMEFRYGVRAPSPLRLAQEMYRDVLGLTGGVEQLRIRMEAVEEATSHEVG